MIPSQSGAKRTPATNGQGIVADAGHNQLFLPLTPEKAATVALGLNVRAPNQHSPQFVIAHLTQNHQPPNRYQLMCLCWYCTPFLKFACSLFTPVVFSDSLFTPWFSELRNMFLKHVMCIGWKVIAPAAHSHAPLDCRSSIDAHVTHFRFRFSLGARSTYTLAVSPV